jgi:hypothetical protein
MDPITLAAGKKALALTWKHLVVEKVVARWSNYRAEIFTRALIGAFRSDRDFQDTRELDEALRAMVDADWKEEAIFDAYRRVSLARSRDIGPCVIGLMTAELLLDQRKTDDATEVMFEAAERLSDGDLRDFLSEYGTWTGSADERGDIYHPIETITHDLAITKIVDTSSMLPGLGSWAVRAQGIGLIGERIEDESGEFESRYSVEPIEYRKVVWKVYMGAEHRPFAAYVTRAIDALRGQD